MDVFAISIWNHIFTDNYVNTSSSCGFLMTVAWHRPGRRWALQGSTTLCCFFRGKFSFLKADQVSVSFPVEKHRRCVFSFTSLKSLKTQMTVVANDSIGIIIF